jgi:hypothetical protein
LDAEAEELGDELLAVVGRGAGVAQPGQGGDGGGAVAELVRCGELGERGGGRRFQLVQDLPRWVRAGEIRLRSAG